MIGNKRRKQTPAAFVIGRCGSRNDGTARHGTAWHGTALNLEHEYVYESRARITETRFDCKTLETRKKITGIGECNAMQCIVRRMTFERINEETNEMNQRMNEWTKPNRTEPQQSTIYNPRERTDAQRGWNACMQDIVGLSIRVDRDIYLLLHLLHAFLIHTPAILDRIWMLFPVHKGMQCYAMLICYVMLCCLLSTTRPISLAVAILFC